MYGQGSQGQIPQPAMGAMRPQQPQQPMQMQGFQPGQQGMMPGRGAGMMPQFNPQQALGGLGQVGNNLLGAFRNSPVGKGLGGAANWFGNAASKLPQHALGQLGGMFGFPQQGGMGPMQQGAMGAAQAWPNKMPGASGGYSSGMNNPY